VPRAVGAALRAAPEVRYRADEQPGSVVVHGVGPPRGTGASASAGSGRRVAIDLGPPLGAVSFGYRSLTAWTRGSRVVATGDGFAYRDVGSGAPFDMYTPFPELDCEARPAQDPRS